MSKKPGSARADSAAAGGGPRLSMRLLLSVAAVLLVAGWVAALAGLAGFLVPSASVVLVTLSLVLLTLFDWQIVKQAGRFQTKDNQLSDATASNSISDGSPASSSSRASDCED